MEVIRKHFTCIGSTNTWAKENAEQFSPLAITLVTANEQTAGRGRFKRHWESPPDMNIYASYCFFLKQRSDMANIPQVMAIIIAEIIQKVGFMPSLKWPNDILLRGKKVAGILAETTSVRDQICMIIGIGVNVNMPENLLAKIDRPATSLLVEGKQIVDREEILEKITQQFTNNLEIFLKNGFHPFLTDYRKWLASSFQTRIRFHDSHKIWEGIFHSINDDGSLNLQLGKEIKRLTAGEILF